jgi:hypothetical protein
MQLQLDSVSVETLAREYRRFIDWSGSKVWNSKIEKLRNTPKFSKADLYGKYLSNRNSLTAAIAEYLSLVNSGKSIRKNTSRRLLEMGGPIYLMNRLVHLLGTIVQKRISGVLRDDVNVRAFLFELQIAIHFFRQDYDVQFADLVNLGNYDLLVSKGNFELEIECKRKSVDAGRKVPRPALFMLTDIILGRLGNFKDYILVTVSLTSRLQARHSQLVDLAKEIHLASTTNVNAGNLGQFSFTITRLSLRGPIRTDDDAARVLSPYWSDDAHFAISSDAEQTLILKCQGVEKDEVLNAISDELKSACDQFSRNRPALIACFLEEIDDSAWVQLADKSGLQVMTHELFNNPERSHVSFIVYSSDKTSPREDGESTEFSSTTLSFKNPLAKFPFDALSLRR